MAGRVVDDDSDLADVQRVLIEDEDLLCLARGKLGKSLIVLTNRRVLAHVRDGAEWAWVTIPLRGISKVQVSGGNRDLFRFYTSADEPLAVAFAKPRTADYFHRELMNFVLGIEASQ